MVKVAAPKSEIIDRLRSGDENAINDFYRDNETKLTAIARSQIARYGEHDPADLIGRVLEKLTLMVRNTPNSIPKTEDGLTGAFFRLCMLTAISEHRIRYGHKKTSPETLEKRKKLADAYHLGESEGEYDGHDVPDKNAVDPADSMADNSIHSLVTREVIEQYLRESMFDQKLAEALILYMFENMTGDRAARTAGVAPSTLSVFKNKLLGEPDRLPSRIISDGISDVDLRNIVILALHQNVSVDSWMERGEVRFVTTAKTVRS